MISYFHKPVMLEEVLKCILHLDEKKYDEDKAECPRRAEYVEDSPAGNEKAGTVFGGGVYIDATLGGGGHSEAILRKILPLGKLIGIDCDKDGVLASQERLKSFSGNLTIVKDNFRNIKKIWKELKLPQVNGILFDLGVSLYQLKEGERGFSFNQDYPLDMRLDRSGDMPAEYLVNSLPYEPLSKIIFEYGEERFSRRIAKAIIFERAKQPIKTTGQLAEIVKKAVPGRGRVHPATRTFQALRIAVNDELKALEDGLSGALDILAVKGRIAVLSYHSLEDRIVKNIFRNKAREGGFVLITKKPLVPALAEISENPSSRSAKLRVIEREF